MKVMSYSQCLGNTFFVISSLGLICGVSSNADENKLQNVSEFINVTTIDNKLRESCTHQGDIWDCCLEIEGKLNITCISIEYLRDEIGLELNITVAGLLIINRKVSVRNPPPICANVPYFKEIADVCFAFHDLEEKNNYLNGCIRIEGQVEGFQVFKVELGCFKIPLFSQKQNETNIDDNYAVYFMKSH